MKIVVNIPFFVSEYLDKTSIVTRTVIQNSEGWFIITSGNSGHGRNLHVFRKILDRDKRMSICVFDQRKHAGQRWTVSFEPNLISLENPGEILIEANPKSIDVIGPGVISTFNDKDWFQNTRKVLRFMWAEWWENPDDQLEFSTYEKQESAAF